MWSFAVSYIPTTVKTNSDRQHYRNNRTNRTNGRSNNKRNHRWIIRNRRSNWGGILWRTRWITSKNKQIVRDTDQNPCEYVELVNKAWSIPSVSWLKDIKNCGSIAIYRPTAFENQVGWSTIKTKYGMERIYQDMVIYQPILVASHINKQTNTFASNLFSKDKKYGIWNNSNCKG